MAQTDSECNVCFQGISLVFDTRGAVGAALSSLGQLASALEFITQRAVRLEAPFTSPGTATVAWRNLYVPSGTSPLPVPHEVVITMWSQDHSGRCMITIEILWYHVCDQDWSS